MLATSIVTVIATASSLGQTARAQPVVPSPLVVIDQIPVEQQQAALADKPAIVECGFDELAYRALHGLGELRIAAFPSPTGPLDLDLVSFDVLSTDAAVVVGTANGDVASERPDVLLLRGSVAGIEGSHVFLGISPLGTNGWIAIEDQRFIIASSRIAKAAELSTVIYDFDALPEGSIEWAPFECGTPSLPEPDLADTGAALPAIPSAPGSVSDNSTCRVVKVAIDTDYEYTASSPFFGNTTASQAYAVTLLGAISEIYRRDFDTVLEVTFVRAFSSNTDPYSAPSPGGRLDQLRSWWRGNMGHVERNNAHLLSGIGGGGVAWLSTLCNSTRGYAFSGVNGSFPYPLGHNNPQNWDVMVVAHETGHSFGALHTHELCPPIDQCPGSFYWGPCQNRRVCTNQGTIMSYCHLCSGGMTNIRLEFHERTISSVRPTLVRATCLTGTCACYPDCDQSTGVGVLDVFDFLCFQDSFVGGKAYACDCDTSTGGGVCDVFDFLCFQDAFVGGCP